MNNKKKNVFAETNEKIYEEISRKAKIISENKMAFIEKIEADKELCKEMLDAKIKFILNTMISERIIDNFERVTSLSGSDIFYGTTRYTVIKKGCSNVVHIITNGEHIVLRDGGFLVDYGILDLDCVRCKKIDNINEYDWIDFVNKLLEFIYKTIYNNTKINSLYLFGD